MWSVISYLLLTIVAVLVLCSVIARSSGNFVSGEMTEARRRQLRRAARRARDKEKPHGLPWFGKRKRTRRNEKYHWDD